MQTAAAAAAALPVLGQQHQHSSSSSTSTAAYKPKWATPAEMQQLAEVADLILPRTDTPGASDAKVQEYIDFQLAKDKVRQTVLREGLRWLADKPDKTKSLTEASHKPITNCPTAHAAAITSSRNRSTQSQSLLIRDVASIDVRIRKTEIAIPLKFRIASVRFTTAPASSRCGSTAKAA